MIDAPCCGLCGSIMIGPYSDRPWLVCVDVDKHLPIDVGYAWSSADGWGVAIRNYVAADPRASIWRLLALVIEHMRADGNI